MSCSLASSAVQPVACEHFADDDGAGDDHGRAFVRGPATAPLLQRQRGQPFELFFGFGAREHVAVHALGVVLDEPEIERRERRDRAGDADRTAGLKIREVRSGRAAQASKSSPKRSVSRTQPRSRLVWKETPSGPPSTSSVEPPPTSTISVSGSIDAAGGDSAERQRLVVSGEQPSREAVAPLDLAEERLAVLGVANGARGDGERSLGAEASSSRRIVGEAVTHAGDGEEEAPATVHVLRPSRVIWSLRATSSTRLSTTSATRRRVEFVPRSTAATRQGVKKRAKRYAVLAPRTPPKSTRTGRPSAGGARRRVGAARSSARGRRGAARARSTARSAMPTRRSFARSRAGLGARPAAR